MQFQYKTYVKKIRNKSNFYKQKKTELEHLKAEVQILERTTELLTERFEELKDECVYFKTFFTSFQHFLIQRNEGRGVIETLNDSPDHENQKRPQTSKPKTNDVSELRQMAEQLNNELNEKHKSIQQLNEKIDTFYQTHKVI